MKIEIDYNGSLAACKVNGKPFNKCDVNEQVFAMDAFRTIIKYWERQLKEKIIMKSHTDIEQSKRLSEILSIEGADMKYPYLGDGKYGETARIGEPIEFSGGKDIPAWSLAALLSVIPQEIFEGEYVINITEGCDNRWVLTYDHCEIRNHSYYGLFTGADNLVDACYEMILKLNERKLI